MQGCSSSFSPSQNPQLPPYKAKTAYTTVATASENEPPKMPRRRSLKSLMNQRYPLTVPEISETDLKALIRVLVTDAPLDVFPFYEQITNDEIQNAIKRLPSTLCRKMSIFSPSTTSVPAARMCATHKGLNPYIISHIFRLVKRETGEHLNLLINWYPGYPQSLQPDVNVVVKGLRCLRGMWSYDEPDHTPASDALRPQQNKCEACILSRVFTEPEHLRYLRIAVSSRTRERRSYRPPPKLSRILEEALNQRHARSLKWIVQTSPQLSVDFKQARKVAARCKPSRRYSRRCNSSQCKVRQLRSIISEEEPSGIDANRNVDPEPSSKRRPSSQTIYFCMLPDSISPLKPVTHSVQETGSSDYNKRQSELIQDILDFYSERRMTVSLNQEAEARPLTSNSHYRSSTSMADSNSEWEDSWDTTTIRVQRTSTTNHSGGQIGDLLIDDTEERPQALNSRAQLRPNSEPSFKSSPRRRITIVDPPSPSERPPYPTAEEYTATLEGWTGFYSDGESRDYTVDEQSRRKGSEATTWSMLWHDAVKSPK